MSPISFLFGLAIFLFAMRSLESGIRATSGEKFKQWIIGRTSNPVSSATCGVVVTAILQSSSMVSLLVLAFVSAGIMPLYNGIGVVLGANLGTTMTGWVVTLIGFKMNFEALVIPLLGIGAALNIGYIKNRRVTGIGKAMFALGLLVFGLDIMKASVSEFSTVYDIQSFGKLPVWLYLLAGVILAGVMQSSSAVMIITLSLLHSDLLQLSDAAAIVIGADLGTTSTTILGSVGQSIIKKQLALAHVVFNIVVDSLAFFLLLPVLPATLEWFAVTDPLFGLVAFHSVFNLLGVFVFLPFLRLFTRWIQWLLPSRKDLREDYFRVPTAVPEAGINSLRQAFEHVADDAIQLNLSEFRLDRDEAGAATHFPAQHFDSFEEPYNKLKVFEDKVLKYAEQLLIQPLDSVQTTSVTRLVDAVRAIVYATKTLKDMREDLRTLAQTSEQTLSARLGENHRRYLKTFYQQLVPIIFSNNDVNLEPSMISKLREHNERHHRDANKLVTEAIDSADGASSQLSTWFNLNHEIHHYARYMISAAEFAKSSPQFDETQDSVVMN